MKILLCGDGPLTRELGQLVEDTGHQVAAYFMDEQETPPVQSWSNPAEDGVELVVEAVLADPGAKWEVITALDRALPATVPILTAALNASATEVASWCDHPGRVVGWAALPPLSDSDVIEFMPALQSDEASREEARRFWQALAREPVEIADSTGGVLPRVLCNLVNEAAYALMEGVASAEDIDLAMQLGTGYPRGPLAWGDLIGLDQVTGILDALGEAFGADQYRPAPLLRQYARAGRRLVKREDYNVKRKA
jgi:3-hydroxybutyryl-CoA dehydrogenase